MRALVVDDSRTMRKILISILKQAGFEQIVEAGGGREALAALAQPPLPELALLDWNMPEMTGYELLKRIRGDGSFNDMRVMMVTTETELQEMEKALQAGANEYVMKPFTKEVILEKLAILGLPTA